MTRPTCPDCGGHPPIADGRWVAHARPPDGRHPWERCPGSGQLVDGAPLLADTQPPNPGARRV